MSGSRPILIKYYNGSNDRVEDTTRRAVKSAVTTAVRKLQTNFFSGLSFHVATSFNNLDSHNVVSRDLKNQDWSSTKTAGLTTGSSVREIYITEQARELRKADKSQKSVTNTDNAYYQNVVMHEIGHQFDNYYYCQDKKLEQTYQTVFKDYYNKDNSPEYQRDLDRLKIKYEQNNELSDTKEFKNALAKDLASISASTANGEFKRFLKEFYETGSAHPTKNDIDRSFTSRSEVFAQAFSYAMGTDDGNKKQFIKLMPETYKQVQAYINKYSRK